MPKQLFPMWIYDAKGKSKEVHTIAQLDAAVADGWAEDPDTAAGKPRPDAGRPADAPWLGDVPAVVQRAAAAKVEYPMWLHHVSKAAVLVQNATQHAALDEGWHESPDEAIAWHEAETKARATVPGATSNTTTEQTSTPPVAPPPAAPLDIVKMSAKEAQLYVGTIDDLDELARVAGLEEANANRVTVKTAIEARLEVLAKAPITPVTPVTE